MLLLRRLLAVGLVAAISQAEVNAQQAAPESAPAITTKPTYKQLLQAIGIDEAQLEKNEELKSAIFDATRDFYLQYGDQVWRACNRASDADSSLPSGSTLLARFIATAADAKAPLKFDTDRPNGVIQVLERGSNDYYTAATKSTEDADRRKNLLESLTFSKALVAVSPADPNYRFNVGYIYQELGEFEKAKSIMDELAPRYSNGFAKAHLWQADQLLSPDRPLTPDVLDAGEAHLMRALATYSEPEQIHRRLGELYYYRYVRYSTKTIDPRIPTREIYLAKAEDHLSRIPDADAKLRLTLAEIRALQGKAQQAEDDVKQVIKELTDALADRPDDLETRLRLAQAYRMVRQFSDAANVLREGQNLNPNVRYDQELSAVYYSQANDIRQKQPTAWNDQFAALRAAYLASPTNNYVAHRFVQALTSPTQEESDAARKTLQALVDAQAPGQFATFLLGFDARRRTLPQKAADYFRKIPHLKPDATPDILAGLTNAMMGGQVTSISSSEAPSILQAALTVWPDNTQLLMVKAKEALIQKDNAGAVTHLTKALEQSPDDVKLHELLAIAYKRQGETDLAAKHERQAAAARSKPSPSKP